MPKITFIKLYIIISFVKHGMCFFGTETLVFGGLTAIGAAIYKNFDRLIGCKYAECCSTKYGQQDWIPVDLLKLQKELQSRLHGQHMVRNIIYQTLHGHFDNQHPKKALVLSFHGWTGSGKNHAAKIIAESLFTKGMKSEFVHIFISTLHFPHEDKSDIYKLQIQDWIRGNVSKCEHSLFIFDEVDKMPLGMIDGIKPFIDYHDSIFGIDYRKTVFLFLSNTGSREIVNKMLLNWRNGNDRRDVKYSDIEELIQKGAFNEKGGLHRSDIIQHCLIDFYVPFLPMEVEHIKLCIRDELMHKRKQPNADFIQKVIDKMIFFPPENKLYSTKGCKSVSSIVNYLLVEQYIDEAFE